MIYASSISKEELNALPLERFNGTIHVIDTPRDASRAALEMSRFPLLGFDTETRPAFTKGKSYQVSLLQLSNETDAWLFRLKKTGITPEMAALLSNPDVLKIGNSPGQDVSGLRALTHFEPQGFVDLQKFGSQFGIEDNALAKITGIVLGFRISKSQQLSNWDNPELTQAQQSYAATDAWVCYLIYKKLTGI